MLEKLPAFSTPSYPANEEPPRIAKAARGGFFVEYRGIPLYSRVDPRAVPERAAAGIAAQESTLYLAPSPLLGYGIETLLNRLPPSSAILGLEADARLAKLSWAELPESLRSHPRFRFLSDISGAARAVYALGRFRRYVEIPLSYGRGLHARAYDLARCAVEAEISRYWRNRLTMIHMGRLWTRNILRNLSRLPEADIRETTPWNCPVVVCGAGPSLEDTAVWLRSESNRIRVLSVDTAVGPLLRSGIFPDAIVCLEGQIHNLKDFLPAGGQPLALFADLTSHPSVFRALQGPKMLTVTRFEPLEFLDRLEALDLPALPVPPLGSVGVLAVNLARLLTRGPVFLAGLDFSFPPGRTHSPGSPALTAETLRQTRLYRSRAQWDSAFVSDPVPGDPGLRTGAALSSYAALLADEIRGDPRVFDLRPRGLPLGVRRVSFFEASGILDSTEPPQGTDLFGLPASREHLRSAAGGFLSGERSRLEGFLASLRSNSPDLPKRTADSAWMYSWFPDEHRVATLPGDVRNRLLAEALDWLRRLNYAIQELEES